jgi:two-component system alkaline phosphatase synthesis response regulator PhoP
VSPRLLLAEDEPGLVMALTDRLQAEGYVVVSATEAPTALTAATLGTFDVIVLDVMLPGGSGFDICRTLREKGIQTPVLMLTARGQVLDRVVGLRLGADDYMVKPFEMEELVARLEALRRRGAPLPPAGSLSFGDVVIDPSRHAVTRRGRPVELSAQEFKLLCYLVEHGGETLSRSRLLQDVWGYQASSATRTVDVHVSWLRQKLEPDARRPRYIQTVHGEGYRFER